jgi:myosin protein heavy chain
MEVDEVTSVPPLPQSTATREPAQPNEKDEIMNTFYCSKCYDMVNYFISECQTLSSELNNVKRIYSIRKKDYRAYKGLYDSLEFTYEEMKAQKEDFEERYNILIKSLTKQQIIKPAPKVEETKHLAVTTVQQVKKSNVVYINDMDAELSDFNTALAVQNQPTLVLDLDVLTSEFSAQANINYQLIFNYFSTKINELNRINSNKLVAYRDKLINKSKTKPAIESKMSSVETASLSIRIDSNKEAEEKMARQEEDLNKLRTDLSDYEKLKLSYAQLNEFVEGAKLENELLQSNLLKSSAQISQISNRNDQLVDQLTQLEVRNANLSQEIETIKQEPASAPSSDYEKLIQELNEKMSTMENETRNLKELNKMLLNKKQEDTEKYKADLDTAKSELSEKLRNSEEHANSLELELNSMKQDTSRVIDEMKQAELRLSQELNELRLSYENLSSETSQTVSRLNEESSALRSSLESRDHEIAALRAELDASSQQKAGLCSSLDSLKSESDAKEAQIQGLSDNLAQATQAYELLHHNHHEMTQQAEQSFGILNTELDMLKQQNQELNARLSQVKDTESRFVQTNTTEWLDQEAQTDLVAEPVLVQNQIDVEDMITAEQHLDDAKQRNDMLRSELDERIRLFEDRALEIGELIKQNNQLRSNELAHIDSLTRMSVKLTWSENEVSSLRAQLAEIELNYKSQFELGESLKQSVYLKEQEFMSQTSELNNAKRQLIELELSYNNQLETTESLKLTHGDKEAHFSQAIADKEQRIAELSDEVAKLGADLTQSGELAKEYEAKWSEQMSKYAELEKNANSLALDFDRLRQEHDLVLASQKENMDKWRTETKEKVEAMIQEIERLERELADAADSSLAKQNEFSRIEASLRSENEDLTAKLAETQLEQAEQIKQLETKTCELSHAEASRKQENEALRNQIEQLESKLSEFGQAEAELKQSNEQLESRLNETLNQIELLKQIESKLNAEMSRQNESSAGLNKTLESLSAQVSELKANLEAQAQANKQLQSEMANQATIEHHLREELEFLKATSSHVNETNNDLNSKLNQYQIQIKEGNSELQRLSSENKNLTTSIEHLKDAHFKLDEMSKSYASLKQHYAEKELALKKLHADYESASLKLKDSESLKQLELAELKKNYERGELLLKQQVKELSDMLQTSESRVAKLQANEASLSGEVSELRAQLTETLADAEKIKYDFEKKFEHDLHKNEQRAIEFELKYKEQTSQNEEMQHEYERRMQALIDNEIRLADAITSLNRSLNEQYAHVETLNKHVDELSVELSERDTQLSAKSEQISQWLEKYTKQSNRLSEMESHAKGLIDNIHCLDDTISKLSNEKTEMSKGFEEFKAKYELANGDKVKLDAELEASNREKFELQRKLCDSFKEIFEKSNKFDAERKQLEESNAKLQNKLDHLEAVLKQQSETAKTAPAGALAKNMNESLISKMENRIDQNIQHKLDVLYDEKHKSLIEIEHLNAEIKNLKLQLETQKEKITKENKKMYKEQIHNYERTIAKQTNEMKRLKEVNDDMQETNDFLNNQINNLNQQIFELNNKENDYEVIDKSDTPNSASSSSSLSKPKLGNQNNYINKKLLDSSLSIEYVGAANNNKQHLHEIDMNNAKSANRFDENVMGTPMNPNKSKSNIPATPSSSVRKQNQCAQQ